MGPRAPERDQEGWSPACDEAAVSAGRPGCRMESGFCPHRHRGPRRLDTLQSRGGSCSGAAPRRGPGSGWVLAMLGSLDSILGKLGHHGDLPCQLGAMLVFAQAFQGEGRPCRWTTTEAQQDQLQTGSCHHVSVATSPQGPQRCWSRFLWVERQTEDFTHHSEDQA